MDESLAEEERCRLLRQILSFRETYSLLRAGTFDHWLHFDLTMSQVKTLILVYTSETGCLRMGQLASALGVALSSATGIVDRLVEQGLLLRHEDPEDRRSVVVRLTDRGRELIEVPHQASMGRLAAVLERLTLDELRTIVQALAAVRRALHEVAGAGGASVCQAAEHPAGEAR